MQNCYFDLYDQNSINNCDQNSETTKVLKDLTRNPKFETRRSIESVMGEEEKNKLQKIRRSNSGSKKTDSTIPFQFNHSNSDSQACFSHGTS